MSCLDIGSHFFHGSFVIFQFGLERVDVQFQLLLDLLSRFIPARTRMCIRVSASSFWIICS